MGGTFRSTQKLHSTFTVQRNISELDITLYLVRRLSHFLAIWSAVSFPSRPRPFRMVLGDTEEGHSRSAQRETHRWEFTPDKSTGQVLKPKPASYLHAILAEFLLPVNRASLDALNSISLFTSSSVTAGGGGQRSPTGKQLTCAQEPAHALCNYTVVTYFYRSFRGRLAAADSGLIPL